MRQVKVVWPELSISCIAATPQRKRKKKSYSICNIYRAKKEVLTNKFALTHAYNPLTPLLNSHLQLHIQFSHTISSVTQQLPPVTHLQLQAHMMLDTLPESILV